MTNDQKNQILMLKQSGLGYVKIARRMNISENTVKTFLRRTPKTDAIEEKMPYCQNCGKPVFQDPHRKQKRFCSDKCRMAWWNQHQEKVNRKANYEFTCSYCGKAFTAYGNANRKYCSHECYIEDRFGGVR